MSLLYDHCCEGPKCLSLWQILDMTAALSDASSSTLGSSHFPPFLRRCFHVGDIILEGGTFDPFDDPKSGEASPEPSEQDILEEDLSFLLDQALLENGATTSVAETLQTTLLNVWGHVTRLPPSSASSINATANKVFNKALVALVALMSLCYYDLSPAFCRLHAHLIK